MNEDVVSVKWNVPAPLMMSTASAAACRDMPQRRRWPAAGASLMQTGSHRF